MQSATQWQLLCQVVCALLPIEPRGERRQIVRVPERGVVAARSGRQQLRLPPNHVAIHPEVEHRLDAVDHNVPSGRGKKRKRSKLMRWRPTGAGKWRYSKAAAAAAVADLNADWLCCFQERATSAPKRSTPAGVGKTSGPEQ